jgi:hypothetical protein
MRAREKELTSQSGRLEASAVLGDGLTAGLIGALTVIGVYLVADALAGAPLRTPSSLAAALFQGIEAAASAEPEITSALAYNAVHVLLWALAGVTASYFFALADVHPEAWYLLFVGVVVLFGWFLGLDVAVGSIGLGRVHLWLGGILGAAAMASFLWWRHPGVFQRAQHAFDRD